MKNLKLFPNNRVNAIKAVMCLMSCTFGAVLSGIAADCAISNPPPPAVRCVAAEFKPGATISIVGDASGTGFRSFRVQWALGLNPLGGWTNTGISLVGNGANPMTNSTLATWTSGTFTQAAFYSIRLLVDDTTVTNVAATYVYFEPDLYSTNWPKWLDQGPGRNSVMPVRDALGHRTLALQNPIYLGSTLPSRLWMFEVDGSSFVTNVLNYGGYMQPAVGDLDGLPGDEIVSAEGHNLRVFKPDLTTMYSLPSTHNVNFQETLVTLADLDGDGGLEILALGSDLASSDGWLFAWKTNGQLFSANYPLLLPDANTMLRGQEWNRVVPVDLDRDGIPELLVVAGDSSSSFSLRMYHADGSPYNWPTITLAGTYEQVAVGDLDGDGFPEIVLGYADNNDNNWIQAYSTSGAPLPGWPRQLGGGTPVSVRLADLNRDGRDEIIVVEFADLYVFNRDGSYFPGAWPIQGSGFQPLTMPAIADIDGDGSPEIVTVRADTIFSSPFYSDPQLMAFHSNGTLARSWHLFGANGNQPAGDGPPIVGDFDGDGKVDIAVHTRLISGGDISGDLQEGVMTVFRLGTPYRPDHRDWPMNYHDVRNSTAAFIPGKLRLAQSGTNVVLSWPSQPDAGLVQYSDDLRSNSWSYLPNTISPTNGVSSAVLRNTNAHRWYRLQYP